VQYTMCYLKVLRRTHHRDFKTLLPQKYTMSLKALYEPISGAYRICTSPE
jgi:hypothetical protein